MIESIRKACLALCSGLFMFVVASTCGCRRPAEAVFSIAAETAKLPETHQARIREQLTVYFGTSANPRLRVPAGAAAEDGTVPLVDAVTPEHLQQGAAVFHRHCAGCHGITGDGAGEAAGFLQPKPRDYRRGVFKFTATPYGAKPHRADLIQVIRRGAKGTSMPSFKFLPDGDVQAVTDYVIMLSHRGEVEREVAQIAEVDYDADQPIDALEFTEALARIHETWQQSEYQAVMPVTAQPKMTDDTIMAGRRAFLAKGCSKCHGDDFRGQTAWLSHEFLAALQAKPEAEREQINYDAWGDPAPAADLTSGMLHGGRRPIDIYRRIYTGINGTPMPAFDQALAAEPDTVWHLVHYVRSVAEGRKVPGLDAITPPPATDNPPVSASEN